MVGLVRLALFLGVLLGAPALPAAAAHPARQLLVMPTACPPGTVITVRGTGFPPLAFGTLALGRAELGSFSTDASGDFVTRWMVPNLEPGLAKLRATVGDARTTTKFAVLPSGSPSPCRPTS